MNLEEILFFIFPMLSLFLICLGSIKQYMNDSFVCDSFWC
jgi:hypothetical protein